MDWAPVTGFVGVLAGGLLTFFTTRHQLSTARQDRIEAERVELYSEWITGVDRIVYSSKPPDRPLDIVRNKLLLLEPSERLRSLIAKVWDAVPDRYSGFYESQQEDPDTTWAPFDTALVELTDAVRASLK